MGAIKDKLAGSAKKLEGRLTGDKVRSAQGSVQKTKGDVEGKIDQLKVRGRAKIDQMRIKRAAKKATR